MCHAPRNSSQPSLQPASPEDSFDDFEEFPRDDVEATTRFAAQTVMPKEAPKIVRDTAESEEDDVPYMYDDAQEPYPEDGDVPPPEDFSPAEDEE